jgi:hypothetical protein
MQNNIIQKMSILLAIHHPLPCSLAIEKIGHTTDPYSPSYKMAASEKGEIG